MNWLLDNKEWVFSGIGVFLLALFAEILRRLGIAGIASHIEGYYVPATLSHFRHEAPLANGKVTLTARRITSISALRSKVIRIQYPLHTRGSIKTAVSLSDPGRMRMIQPGNHEASNCLDIVARRGQHYLVVSESTRSVPVQDIGKEPSEHNVVLHNLFTSRLKQGDRRDYAGTRVFSKTDSVRLILEFPKGFGPDIVNPIQIGEHGSIIRDEKSKDFVMASHKDNTVFILDLRKPRRGSGVYLWWEWPSIETERDA